MRVLGVIPARYHSQRLPGKVLLPLRDKPMIQHVYERARKVFGENIIVATDDMRVVEAVEAFGGRAVMTRTTHASGTERVGEVAERFIYDAYVNIQADEPFIEAEQLRLLLEALKKHPLVTLMHRVQRKEELITPSAVKVVVDKRGKALYFSRAILPYPRGVSLDNSELVHRMSYYRHIGVYGYHRSVLMEIVTLSPSPLEEVEQLEQLRWLYHGYEVWVWETPYRSYGIDTPEEYEMAQKLAETLL
ncbi:MAG: 3-deoxy-manno-octulosonate cytidylyltransferase [Bacteroidia bacterium]|nr:3-deoxy-manno-octulosonate cytidylyltransferase [Bacteroidia bacterium]MDW8134287.1 3-deoxy-manno-octulosonate cytidylyltransferase [Bacteroidia bacterium]